MTPRTRPGRPAGGYAMVLVVLFMVLFLGLWGQAARQIGSMIRIEEARDRRVRRDADRLLVQAALARGLAALEQGYPPADPFTCVVEIRPADADYRRDPSEPAVLFALTYARETEDPAVWTVAADATAPAGLPPLDPSSFKDAPP